MRIHLGLGCGGIARRADSTDKSRVECQGKRQEKASWRDSLWTKLRMDKTLKNRNREQSIAWSNRLRKESQKAKVT